MPECVMRIASDTIELGLSASESSTRISNLYFPTDSEYKFHNMGIENWLHIGLNLGSS